MEELFYLVIFIEGFKLIYNLIIIPLMRNQDLFDIDDNYVSSSSEDEKEEKREDKGLVAIKPYEQHFHNFCTSYN